MATVVAGGVVAVEETDHRNRDKEEGRDQMGITEAEGPADFAGRADVKAEVAFVGGDLLGTDEEDEGEHRAGDCWEGRGRDQC